MGRGVEFYQTETFIVFATDQCLFSRDVVRVHYLEFQGFKIGYSFTGQADLAKQVNGHSRVRKYLSMRRLQWGCF